MPFSSIRARWRRRHSFVILLLLVLAAACLPQYVSAYTVSGPSEAPTLLLGDRVIVNRAAFDLKLPYRLSGWHESESLDAATSSCSWSPTATYWG